MTFAQRQWILAVVATVGLFGTLTVAYLLLSRGDWRLDLTPQQQYVLSERALRVLGALEHDVDVIAFLRSNDPRNHDIEDLLRRVANASPRVRSRVVDANRNPGVARRYEVKSYGSLVVETGGRSKRVINPDEESLMTAIAQLTRAGRRVYFLSGHGERDTQDHDRRTGYSGARTALIQELYDVADLGVLGERPVPSDASVLVIAAPRSDLLAGELLRLDEYVRHGGRLLVLLDPGTAPGLAAFLRRYGIHVGDGVVMDSENRLFAGDFLTMAIPEHSSSHPVSAGLAAEPLMSQVRPIQVVEADGVVAAVELLRSSTGSWQTSDPSVLETGVGRPVSGQDTQGPISVGASVALAGDDGRSGRILVYGDSDFATNFFLDYLGNRDLLLNSVNWLAGEEGLIASRRPRQVPGVNQFFVTERQGALAFWIGTVIQPAIMLLVGIVVYVRRQRSG